LCRSPARRKSTPVCRSSEAATSEAFTEILFDTPEPAIARITLNRPQRLNAYNARFCDELVRRWSATLARREARSRRTHVQYASLPQAVI
jgi:1,4-dihydroxy-2-naphthoyl-CoA synthase